jgi:hypothetical protein
VSDLPSQDEVDVKPPAPPRVTDRYQYWGGPPPEISPRCQWWVHRIEKEGWRPNKRVRAHGYDSSAQFYGIYIWEYLHVIDPLLGGIGDGT